ncbi:hypothetical protein [Oceanibaculum nanhaiense]|uniref:hypothetical protein n=1 Tax=Oceanibaculum nanhaiense TaxID=1909734 RepID=UPI003D287AF5
MSMLYIKSTPQQTTQMLFAAFFLAVGWRIAATGDTLGHCAFALIFGIAAATRLNEAHTRWRAIRTPRPVSLVPPLWAVIILGVLLFAWAAGTPHLRLPGCVYVGWNGAVENPPGGCSLIRFLPLTD